MTSSDTEPERPWPFQPRHGVPEGRYDHRYAARLQLVFDLAYEKGAKSMTGFALMMGARVERGVAAQLQGFILRKMMEEEAPCDTLPE